MKVGVVLAAGASTRMRRPKALASTRGESFTAHVVRLLWSVCDTVVIVLGAEATRLRKVIGDEFVELVESGRLHADLQTAHRHGADGLEVQFVVNRAWRRGMLGSVRTGLRGALPMRPESVIVVPVDHPAVKESTVRLLAAAMDAALAAYKGSRASRAQFAYAVIPRHRRRRGHPIVLSPGLVRAIAGDSGAADLSDAVRRNARLVGYLDVADPGVVRNRNTPRD